MEFRPRKVISLRAYLLLQELAEVERDCEGFLDTSRCAEIVERPADLLESSKTERLGRVAESQMLRSDGGLLKCHHT